MTLGQIMRLALRQLDEDPADIAEYAELFRMWANQGYQIILGQYYKPREMITLQTDENGKAYIEGMDIARFIDLKDENEHDVWAEISPDGTQLITVAKDKTLTAVCEMKLPPLENDSDTPRFPEEAHSMLVDYICYKHLMRGNLAKQSRAQAFQNEFYRQAQQLKPQAGGSVTGFKNLYAVTEARYVRW